LHGEHKTRGGKLVVADLEVREGLLADVKISGDFFLEPPEALSRITEAVEGAPADLEEDALASRVREGLGAGVEMVGFSPESVAAAVRKALS
jgi:hypothetical protein